MLPSILFNFKDTFAFKLSFYVIYIHRNLDESCWQSVDLNSALSPFNVNSVFYVWMHPLDMLMHVSFLIEFPATIIYGACERLVICMCTLVWKELVHTFEHLHAHLWSVRFLWLAEEIHGYGFEAAILYHFM